MLLIVLNRTTIVGKQRDPVEEFDVKCFAKGRTITQVNTCPEARLSYHMRRNCWYYSNVRSHMMRSHMMRSYSRNDVIYCDENVFSIIIISIILDLDVINSPAYFLIFGTAHNSRLYNIAVM